MARIPFTLFLAAALLVGNRALCEQEALFAGPYIIGSTVYTARDFAPEFARHIGQPTSRPLLESIRSAIRIRYARDGYVTPIVSIPEQDGNAVNPRLIVHEARINAVEIRGDAGPYRKQIAKLVLPLQQSAPLRKQMLRSILARIGQLPGITSRPLFDPRPESTNEFLLVLRVQFQPVASRIELNNGGTDSLGRELLGADVATSDLLGLQEQLHLDGAISSHPGRYQYGEARAQRDFSDTTIFVDVSDSKALPDPSLYFRDAHFSAGLTQRWQSSADGVISLGATFSGDNGSIRDRSTDSLIEDHDRNVALGLTWARNDGLRPNRLFLGVQRGIDVAGSVVNEGVYSRVDPEYLKYLVDAEQVIQLGSTWSIQANLSGQVTSAIVPVLERFTFGGIGFGAAFDPGSLSGDSGAEVGAQLAHVIDVHRWDLDFLRLYVRSDAGISWNNSPYFHHREEATSAGGGIFLRWPHVQSTLELSTPVDRPSDVPAQSVRTFGSVAYVFR